jgi:hypothetical protein
VSEGTRVNVNLGQDDMDWLQEYRRRKGITLTEAVVRAVSVLRFVDAVQRREAKVGVTEVDGRSRDVEFVGL